MPDKGVEEGLSDLGELGKREWALGELAVLHLLVHDSPGESMMLAVELVPDRDLRTRTTVTATPVDEDGEELPGTASTTVTFFVDTVDPGGIPSFGEGLETSWDLLVALGRLALLIAGAVLPFLWVPVIMWLGLRMWRTRNGMRPAEEPEATV